ncbi:GTP-binding protein [[Clostridium] dakarense]|uniref:GTP-binding protein n=1 Tax=Faecalimicrobium dakarense TaxID=1301100 RepID=UPI0004BB12E4|nr:TetM/TetW/TetO/TetS family tetracycline resistance ribosomal protection protein [[Clostridium] dakarense]
MNKTIGVLAHVDAGKTTFCEQVLYHTNSIRSRGRVDSKNTFLDNHNIERQRGITIFSEQGVFKYNNSNYFIIDTPGHIDFSPDMERSISIMDYAVVIISAVEKIQSHTKTVFRLLKKYKVPIIFFVNKIDREGANVDEVIKDIKDSLTADVIDINENFILNKNNADLNEELIEFIAERDDSLFEKYLNDRYNLDLWIDNLKDMIKNTKIYPLLKGSALNDIGILEFIEKLDFLTYTSYKDNDKFIGKVYKVKHDENKNRVTYIKAFQGKLQVKNEVSYKYKEEITNEKINAIRIYNSNKFEAVSEVSAGEIFAALGITNINTGNYLVESNTEINYLNNLYNNQNKLEITPTLKSKVIFDNSLNIKDVLNAFNLLDLEEPVLNVLWDEQLKEIHIHVMGKIQLEILKEIVRDRFNIEVEFGPCEILYKETIKEKIVGYGHFEPIGHYAEVHLLIEPGPRNSKLSFESKAHVDDISIGHQNLIKTHIFEKEHRGILAGYNLTDLKITLLTGRAHNKHTSGGDFRQATLRALRQGLESSENIILEPYYKFKIEVDLNYIGRVLSDISKMNGQFEPPIMIDNIAIIEGRGPVATFMDYSLELLAFSKGSGSINLIFDGYDICHNSEEVIEKRDYDKNADSEYTSNSIFCSKGQAYIVEGSNAKNSMHCLK